MFNCYRCGRLADITIEDGSAVCERCEDDYQAAMRETYPYGQCQQCGAEYRPVECSRGGKPHIVAFHSEGGCGQWRDYGAFDADDCPFGGHPQAAQPTIPDGSRELPF